MGKLIAVLLGIAVVGGVGYWAITHAQPGTSEAEGVSEKASPNAPSAAKQRLDNVRQAAQRIEGEAQDRADRAAGDGLE